MKPLRVKLNIPIYDADVWVLVDPDIHEARKTLNRDLGTSEAPEICTAWCDYQPGLFAICFSTDNIGLGTLSHELYHLTRRILKWTSVKDEEAGALLYEYLAKLVFKKLRAHGWKG
jgi:hypothetical protein